MPPTRSVGWWSPDEDAWFAYCPALESYGAATRGSTRDEALRHIREVVGMVVAELVEGARIFPRTST
jgi:predicted RNase H-like HicB family nuclease